MLGWVGFSVTFNRRNQISGSEVVCSFSRHVALPVSHLGDKVGHSHTAKKKNALSYKWQKAQHPGLRRNTETGGENRSKSWDGAKSSLQGSRTLVPGLEGAEAVSGAAVWVTSIILMTLPPSYVREAPPTLAN